MTEERKRIPEDASIAISITPTVSTVGETVYFYAVDEDGTATTLGTATGAAADTAIAGTLDFAGLGAGEYRLQIVANPTGDNPIVLCPSSTYSVYWLDVYDLAAVT